MDDKLPIVETKVPQIQVQKINSGDDALNRVYIMAQAMCPTPLPEERMRSWVSKCPELCLSFQAAPEGGDLAPLGVVLMLPVLKEYWEKLLVGDWKESHLEPTSTLAGEGEADVGMHIFYIERFATQSRLCNFGGLTLNYARELAKRKGWNLIGFSALTATAAGRATCRQLEFMPTGYEEVAFTGRGNFGGQRVSIIYLYPNGSVQGQNGSKQYHSKSEMVVRYENPGSAPGIRSRL